MRTVSFKNDVLHAIAWKLGLDPTVNLLRDQAYAIASYINAWVRRLWDSTDWAEWTTVLQYAPDINHLVLWDADPVNVARDTVSPKIGKVLKVYLVDPASTRLPVDTPFQLRDTGIYVGHEHGQVVWIKFVTRAPQYTANEWDSTTTYAQDAIVYSPVTGDCYRSKSGNNIGHDPVTDASDSTPLSVEEIQPWLPGNPGHPGQPKKLRLTNIGYTPPYLGDLPDPPPNTAVIFFEVHDIDDVFLGDATHTANGTDSTTVIYTDLRDQFIAEVLMSSFTVTLLTPGHGLIEVELIDNSDFGVVNHTYTYLGITSQLLVRQAAAYVPPVPASDGQSQILRVTISPDQVVAGGIYSLTFMSPDNVQHSVSYTAVTGDDRIQILNGLIDAIIAAQDDDAFFLGVQCSLDTVAVNVTFTMDVSLGESSLDALLNPPGSGFWELVPFPFALVDQVVRGAYADALREGGQSDKGDAQETVVPTEETVRVGAQVAAQYDQVTDQSQPKSRYSIK